MLKNGKELKVFAVRDNELQKFCEEAKKYGVLYCVLKDNKAEMCIRDRACSRVLLNFIKNDQRFPSVKRRCIEGCEFCEEKIKIIAIVDE